MTPKDLPLVYTLRPNNTSIWLPPSVVREIGARQGDRLTEAQFSNPHVQQVITERLQAETR